MKSTQKNTTSFALRIAALLFCLISMSAGLLLPSDAQTGGGSSRQKRTLRTRTYAPNSTRPAHQSNNAQVLSESQTNTDGSITPGLMLMDKPVEQSVAEIMTEQAKRPASAISGKLMPEREGPDRDNLPQNPNTIEGTQWPPAERSLLQTQPTAPQTISTQFDGATGPSETGAFPPDTMGAVGPTQVVVFLNGRLRTFNKTTGIADGVINADSDVFF